MSIYHFLIPREFFKIVVQGACGMPCQILLGTYSHSYWVYRELTMISRVPPPALLPARNSFFPQVTPFLCHRHHWSMQLYKGLALFLRAGWSWRAIPSPDLPVGLAEAICHITSQFNIFLFPMILSSHKCLSSTHASNLESVSREYNIKPLVSGVPLGCRI